ncbi:MAG: hypothetical protein OXC83_05810 [Chloroflexi bacterium]|nr:hypothetical protein [Chloroflexota bacterium]
MTTTTIGILPEIEANSAIAQYLDECGKGWSANAERRQTLVDDNGRPDIVVREPGRRAVVLETEYGHPAVGDAESRLGKRFVGETYELTEVIAVGIDEDCESDTRAEFLERLKRDEAVLLVQLVSTIGVWPVDPLLSRPSDLVAYCEYAQVPQLEIDRQSARVARHIESLGLALLNGLRAMTAVGDDMIAELMDIVKADTAEEATRIVCAIWLTTIDLHKDLALYSPTLRSRGLETTQAMRENSMLGVLSPRHLIDAWEVIEGVNYVPVIELAKSSLLAVGESAIVSQVLRNLEELSNELNDLQAKHVYNFAGELWQRLVTDREERAAHYTKPEVAELLATLAAERFMDRSVDEVASLDLMDAACGTGTLIGAGERALRRVYLLKGGSDPSLHRKRMEEHIIALDVNGIAGTMTAKRLTDLEVAQDYQESRIAIVTHEAGSLCLLNPETTGITDMLGSGGRGLTPGQSSNNGMVRVPVGSVDFALMNPPYSRARRGREQATTGLAPLRRVAARYGWLMSHGQAGLGSDFGNMSNMRLKPGGVFAHVLPLTAAHTGSWTQWRREMVKHFEDIVVIANTSTSELQSMSADTGMGEMLVVATKRETALEGSEVDELLCVSLSAAPATMAEGYALGRKIAAIRDARSTGTDGWGSWARLKQNGTGSPWGAVGNRNVELIAVSELMLEGGLYDPATMNQHAMSLPIVTLSELADAGPTHHLIGHPRGSEAIGAFEWTPLETLPVAPSQKSMWVANAQTQVRIATDPTHGGTAVSQSHARRLVAQRSNWFISRNLRWTSQALAFAHTDDDVHGGQAWNALQNLDDEVGRCLALWNNSVFGGIVRNAYGQSSQAGRARIQVNAIPGLPCPDFGAGTAAGADARRVAGLNFAALSALELEPFAYCFRDENRWQIDDVVADMIGLDPSDPDVADMLAHYRLMFASEPNVNGRNRGVLGALGEWAG